MYAYGHLTAPQNPTSGVADFLLFAPIYDFEENGIKSPVAPFTNPGDEIVITTPHVFKAGKGFIKVLLAPEKNQYNAKTTGDIGFQKLAHEYDVFVPGSYAELHEWAKNVLNTPVIALGKDSNCPANMYYQLGTECVYAYISVDFSTGTNKDGIKGYSGKITYSSAFVQLYNVEGGPELFVAE